MGEKGNVASLTGLGEVAEGVGSASVVERTTIAATSTVITAGEDLASAVRSAAIGAVAKDAVDTAKDKIAERRRPTPEEIADGPEPGAPPTA